MKIIKKIKSIINGYSNLLFEDSELEPLFKERYEICKSCENCKLGICTLCGCVCLAKSHSRYEECPANKWNPIIRIDNDGKYLCKSELPENLHKYFKNEIIEFDEWKKLIGEDLEDDE